jgi:hypothetical protein
MKVEPSEYIPKNTTKEDQSDEIQQEKNHETLDMFHMQIDAFENAATSQTPCVSAGAADDQTGNKNNEETDEGRSPGGRKTRRSCEVVVDQRRINPSSAAVKSRGGALCGDGRGSRATGITCVIVS